MKTRFSATAIAAAAIIAVALPAGSASSADVPVPALPWLHEGLVLTFTWYAGVAPGNGTDWQEDPNGNWVDPRTGQHLRGVQQHGTSGSGWKQGTITCIEADKAAVTVTNFADDRAQGNYQPVPQSVGESAFAPVADPGEYWMDPNKLASLHTIASQNILVTHIPWKAGDHTVNATRVQVIKDGSYDDHIYDPKTGLCLHFAGSHRGAPPKYVGPGDMGLGDTTLSRGDFIGARDISVPWAREAMPDAVASLRELHYRGPIIFHGSLPSPNSVNFEDMNVLNHGRGWVELASTRGSQNQRLQTPPVRSKQAFGRSQFGGLWVGPHAVASLKQGQVLDEDPITKIRTYVGKVDERSVVIVSRNGSGEIDNEYDARTGLRIGNSFYDILSQQQWTLRLQGRE